MIEILFSCEFDSGVWKGAKPSGWGAIGQVALGELGLLDLLETQLGLKHPELVSYQRKIDYLNALRLTNTTSRFYSQSLLTDPMAVTEHLLKLRDTLIESGWDKKKIENIKKISDLSEVEKNFTNVTGKADRLIQVHESLLALKAFNQISSISVFDHENSLPSVWKKIFKEALPKIGVKVQFLDDNRKVISDAKLDLHKFLKLRLNESSPIGDESLTILVGRDPWESARFLAAWLLTLSKEELANTVIVAPEKHRGILMTAMLAQGIPFGGNHAEVSYSRPALQIFILALALCWEPKDPSIALSLLTIEGSPVSRKFRNGMVRSLSESLAVGGKTWTKKLEEITAEFLDKAESNEEKQKIESRKQRIKDWFSAPSYSYDSGIPVKEIVEVCSRVSKWLRQMWALQKQSSFREAYELTELFANLAQNLGEPTITRERMIHLLVDSVGDGIIADGVVAQSNGVRVVSSPGAVIQSADNVIWWDFSSSTVSNFKETFFSGAEIQDLYKNKIEWPNPEAQSVSEAKSWARPLYLAKNRAILVSQLLDADGNAESLHPLLDELLPTKIKQKWMKGISVNLLEKQSDNSQKFLKLIGSVQNKEVSNYFVRRPKWQLQKNVVSLRDAESSSSLEQLLGCELAYVLRYKAGLSGEDRSSIQYDVTIMGIIAHEVISLVFKKGATLNPNAAVLEAKKYIDDVIKDKAPQLFQKERVTDLTDIKRIVLQDIQTYAAFISENNLLIEDAELDVKKSEKTLAGVHLNGKIDHVLSDSQNRLLIVDHKFGNSKYREKTLLEGKSLQLALYSKLLSGVKVVNLAYHIIDDNKILALNTTLNQSQRINGPDPSLILLEAEIQIKEKIEILKSGKLLAHGLSEENKNSRFPAPCTYCNFDKICGLAWKQEKS